MKGVLTLNIEVDYATMLSENNLGAIYMFTGAKTVEEMVQVHMNDMVEKVQGSLGKSPLIKVDFEGKLIRDEVQPTEENTQPEASQEELPSEEVTASDDTANEAEVLPYPPEELEKLNSAFEHVSLELGIPQRVKVNGAVMNLLKEFNEPTDEYKGAPLSEEGMEDSFIIVYKSYGSNDIKFYESGVANG